MKSSVARAVARKIGSQFPDSSEGRLQFAIVERAILDLRNREHREAAAHYLAGELRAASLCGIDPAWIRAVLARAGVSVPAPRCAAPSVWC